MYVSYTHISVFKADLLTYNKLHIFKGNSLLTIMKTVNVFIILQSSLVPLCESLPATPSHPAPQATTALPSVTLDQLEFSKVLYKRHHTTCTLSEWAWLLSLSILLWDVCTPLCVQTDHPFLLLPSVPLCECTQVAQPLLCCWTFGLFPDWGPSHTVFMNVRVHIYLQTHNPFSLR